MEASRLVFVSVKNAKPRRKVAIPIPDVYTWEQFCKQIQTKLKLKGVGDIVLASSGEKVTGLDVLQDIDELHVEEAAPPPAAANGPSPDRVSSGSKASVSGSHTNSISPEAPSPKARTQRHLPPLETESRDRASEPEQKYAKRSSGVRRSLQRVLPGLFAPRLPVTTRDVGEEGRKDPRSRRRRRRDSFFAARNLLRLLGLLSFVLVLLFLYSRMVPRLE